MYVVTHNIGSCVKDTGYRSQGKGGEVIFRRERQTSVISQEGGCQAKSRKKAIEAEENRVKVTKTINIDKNDWNHRESSGWN